MNIKSIVNGSIIILCLLTTIYGYSNPKLTVRSGAITIVKATYGTTGFVQSCDATNFVHYECDTKQKCDFLVSDGMCGDPAPNLPKGLVVYYTCGTDSKSSYANQGNDILLSCEFNKK
jgi:hypothetical protein